MDDSQIKQVLDGLSSKFPEHAWSEFLQTYAPLILQVIRSFERDMDHVSDCFLFVCEGLSRSQFRRLRRFRLGGSARFSTWLRVVVRNLCLDWHRREFGRERVFESIGCLSALDQSVFRRVHQEGASEEQAFLCLRVSFPQLTQDQVAESSKRMERLLSPRQRWLLSVRAGKTKTKRLEETESEESLLNSLPALSEDPESVAISEEKRLGLARAISRLPAQDQLLIRLRYGEELTLAQIAQLLGLNDAQRADRRLRQVLERLRGQVK